jgi:hypothetical protein
MKLKNLTVAAIVVLVCLQLVATAQTFRHPISPNQLVTSLYQQHKKHSPFFQGKNRALLDRYFAKELADLIWKDATRPNQDEVGALDGDPLFNAQDMKITKFVLQPAKYEGSDAATVTASFKNFGEAHSVIFELNKSKNGWKISDIRYDDGSRLSNIFKQGN